MPIGFHHVVECHLEHDPGLNDSAEALVFNRVLDEPLRHFNDLGFGQS
jgi:hypothetical protein